MRRILAGLVVLLLSGPVEAHRWYTDEKNEVGEGCCGGFDCGAIPASAVTRNADGSWSVRYSGPLAQWKQLDVDVLVPEARSAPAPTNEGDYHICFYPAPPTVRCFFYPGPGF